MKVLSFILGIMLASAAAVAAQSFRDCVYLWNGFEQEWGYNHRINRLGDFVQVPETFSGECQGRSTHTAASGSGSDRARFRSLYTRVAANGLHFLPGSELLRLEGREGQIIRARVEVTMFDPEIGKEGVEVQALLNGFDLCTADGAKADKIEELSLGIDTVWTNGATHTLHAVLAAEIRFSCSSPECEWFRNTVRYELELHYLLMAGPGFHSRTERIGRGLSWTRDSLPDHKGTATSILGKAGFPVAALGLRGFRVALDREHHLLDWALYTRPGRYEVAGGQMEYEAGLFFAPWDPGQYDAYRKHYTGTPMIPPKWAVQRKNGSAVMEMDVCLLQFQDAAVSPGEIEGEINWTTRPGKQVPARDSMAVLRNELD